MGQLSSGTIDAIAAGCRVRQVWSVEVPRAAGSATLDSATIHDDASGPRCVEDPGTREASGYNISPADPGKLSSGLYRIKVANPLGAFYASGTNWWYNSTGSYQAVPTECRLTHQVYAWIVGTGWYEIDEVAYTGAVQDVQYDDDKSKATIEAKSMTAAALDYAWGEGDGSEVDTGLNVIL